MRILVIIRGQPRCNSNRYQHIIKSTLSWDADVDIIMDAVSDTYSHRVIDDPFMDENVIPGDLKQHGFKDTSTIIENVNLANAWFPERQIKIERLSPLQTQLKLLTGHRYCDWVKEYVPFDNNATNYPENTLGQYMWFFDPVIDYSPYDMLITVRQDCKLSSVLPKDMYDPDSIHFLIEKTAHHDDTGEVYHDMLLGMTHPGYINEINKMLNIEALYRDQKYIHDRFDAAGHWEIEGPSIMFKELGITRQNHKLLLGISKLARNIDRFWPEHAASIDPFVKNLYFRSFPHLMHRHFKTEEDFDFYYKEEYNQKKHLQKK